LRRRLRCTLSSRTSRAEIVDERQQMGSRALAQQGAQNRRRHLHHVEGLLEVVADPAADAFGGALDRAAAGDDDDLDVGELAADDPHQLVAPHPGHVEVDGDEVDFVRAQDLEGLRAALGLQHRVIRGEDHPERFAGAAFVVDDQDGGSFVLCFHAGLAPLAPVKARRVPRFAWHATDLVTHWKS
jgi:hypothetical protein